MEGDESPELGAFDDLHLSSDGNGHCSWAGEVETALREGSLKEDSNGKDWQQIGQSKSPLTTSTSANGAATRSSASRYNDSSTKSKSKTKRGGLDKGDAALREQRDMKTSQPAPPRTKRGVNLGWSDDEEETPSSSMPLTYQTGWEPPAADAWPPAVSEINGHTRSAPNDEFNGLDQLSLRGPDWKGKSREQLPERLWEPTPGSAADLRRQKNGYTAPLPSARDSSRTEESRWRQPPEVHTDRFGNDLVNDGADEDWSKKPSYVVKSTDKGWGIRDRPEVGWGDEAPEATTSDQSQEDGDYDYLEVETVHLDLRGLKVATEPTRTLKLLYLKHLELRQMDWDDVTEDDLEWIAESALPSGDAQEVDEQPGVLGLQLELGGEEQKGKPPAMCISSVERALLIRFPERPVGPEGGRLLATVLHSQRLAKAAFRLYEHVQLLHHHYGIHIARGYDLGETYSKLDLDMALDSAFGITIDREAWHEEGHVLALDAWATCLVAHAAALTEAFNAKMPNINTFELPALQLQAVASGAAVAACLTSMEQREHKGYIERAQLVKGQYILTQGRYSTRARREDRVTLLLEDSTEWAGKVWEADGRDIVVRPVKANAPALDVDSVEDTPCIVKIAPHEPPQEVARRQFSRSFLLGGVDLEESRIIRTLFLDTVEAEDEMPLPLGANVKIEPKLNPAQGDAISKVFSNASGALIHGPPGSGKTTVIAHAAKAFILTDAAPDSTMMIVANSNAAIKQCAEALLKHRIASFRLVTSAEYYVGWHAHHYSASLQRKLVKSDELKPSTSIEELHSIFAGVRIVLCTLATLATRKLDHYLHERRVPLLVADEASQIVWSTFLPPIWKLRRGLRKVVFVGDALQLPPFGAQQNASLVKSVFEIEPRPDAMVETLLDTCYRMPVPLGDFVSDLVYKGTLVSKHDLTNWSCTRFIDVDSGRETRVGVSWSNPQESIACKTLVEKYYSGSSFCIITPYDAQRDLIERELKLAGLPYDGRVQSIDAAQGSEYDYVILSLVRTSRNMGFLSDMRRMNVMLTRQRRGLCIVAHPHFLENAAAGSLVGQLAHYASHRVAWSEKLHIPLQDIVANIASVPNGTL